MFYENIINSFYNKAIYLIKKNPKNKNKIKKILRYKNNWDHMSNNEEIKKEKWIKIINEKIIIISKKDSINWKNFEDTKKFAPNIILVELKDAMQCIDDNVYAVIVCIEHDSSIERQRYSEQLIALYSKKINVYPTLIEGQIYENKRCLTEVLNINNIKSPKTKIINNKEELKNFIEKIKYPIVSKTSLGAGASGVKILKSKKELLSYANTAFGSGYNRKMADYRDKDWGYLILQEYLQNPKEYRVIKIGNSWFAHEKLIGSNGMHSGSGNAKWINPDLNLLDFCLEISIKLNITTAAFDVFHSENNEYYINEIQCWFGSFNKSQMYINEKPGRYIRMNNQWKFEEGNFNIFGGAYLRILELMEMKQGD